MSKLGRRGDGGSKIFPLEPTRLGFVSVFFFPSPSGCSLPKENDAPVAAHVSHVLFVFLAVMLCLAGMVHTFVRTVQDTQEKLDTDAILDRMCELEQMIDDAGGAMDDIAVSDFYRAGCFLYFVCFFGLVFENRIMFFFLCRGGESSC